MTAHALLVPPGPVDLTTLPTEPAEFEGGKEIRLEPDRAISLALVVNELVTNAAKYAFPDRSDGQIWVRLVRAAANSALLSVRDDGVELPADFDIKKGKGLGMRIVAALSEQLGATITQSSYNNGKEFAVLFPCDGLLAPIQVERKTAVTHAANHGSPPRKA